jgi:hypothetical protein
MFSADEVFLIFTGNFPVYGDLPKKIGREEGSFSHPARSH